MARKSTAPPKRGGSDSAREAGLTGVVVHFTEDERRTVGAAAALEGLPGGVKAWIRSVAVSMAQKKLGKIHQNSLD